jgi:hypothetical protein
MVNHRFKFIPSARYVSAAKGIFKDIDLFNKDYISLHFLYFDSPSLSIFSMFPVDGIYFRFLLKVTH